MIAPQNQQPDILDSLMGSKQEWYAAVDHALRVSDVIPGNYEYTTTASYGNSDRITNGGQTNFDIGCNRFEIISLENSYIELQQTITITVPAMNNQVHKLWYIGHKISAAAFVQYQIFTNTDSLQQVNNPNYEWYVLYNSVNDNAKENSDIYATQKKIRELNPYVPGVYVDLSNITAQKTIDVQLPIIRIPLASFLLLFNLKYFPEWAGKLHLETYPSYQNIVVAPAGPLVYGDAADIAPINALIEGDLTYNGGFYNLNQPMKNKIWKDSTTWKVGTNTFTCDSSLTTGCRIKLARNMLKIDVFNAMAMQYIQVPLMFPIQTVQVKNFASELKTNDSIDSTLTLALQHCDAMFIVFRKNEKSTTCFENPAIDYTFNIDGKYYPMERYRTVDDIRNINMTFDALNINNSYLYSIPRDLRSSLQPYYNKSTYAADGTPTKSTVWSGEDRSNFLIGVPFADDDDFMGGINTASSVQIQLQGSRVGTTAQKAEYYGVPVGIFFEDKILKIRAVQPAGAKQIEITGATIDQILGIR